MRNVASYKINGDSIEFSCEGNPIYHFEFIPGHLELKGFNVIRACKFWEHAAYQLQRYAFTPKSTLLKNTINHYQLEVENWCFPDEDKVEKFIPSENRSLRMHQNDTVGLRYFPQEIDFTPPALIFQSNLLFLVDSQSYKITDYSGKSLTILAERGETNYYVRYSPCEYRRRFDYKFK